MVGEAWNRYLAYFDPAVLVHYTGQPDKYSVEDDGITGSIRLTPEYWEELQGRDHPDRVVDQIMFGYRKLVDGRVCIAAFVPDLARLPEEQRLRWRTYELAEPTFASEDPRFQDFVRRNLEGNWDVPLGSLDRLKAAIALLNGMCSADAPLFQPDWNPHLAFPSPDNEEKYDESHLQLWRLVGDGLNEKGIDSLGVRLGRTVSKHDSKGDTLGTLKQLESMLPAEIREVVIHPLDHCRRVRQRVHGIREVHRCDETFVYRFGEDVKRVADGLMALVAWLEKCLAVDARRALDRRTTMQDVFPRLSGPPRPEVKLHTLEKCVGKTIQRVEFGEEKRRPGVHEREGIVFHFADGSAMAIRIGSNASNLSQEKGNLDPSEIHTDLIPVWADSEKT